MNQINQYIFNLYHYLLNFRDTMEYAIPREHDVKVYNARKNVLTKGLEKGTAFGNFLDNNAEKGTELKGKIQEALDELYGDDSNLLVVSGDSIRVDHTQHIKIFEYVSTLGETLRDILYQYLAMARKNKEDEPQMLELLKRDEVLFRSVFCMLILKDFETSFGEFQKVMSESKGEPTPQSNFIVQNEIMKYSSFIRNSRAHAHCTDNETLDLLDDINKVIEMTEGRRDRRDNKSFKEIFDDINKRISEYVAKVEPLWKQSFDVCLKEMMETVQNKAPEKLN